MPRRPPATPSQSGPATPAPRSADPVATGASPAAPRSSAAAAAPAPRSPGSSGSRSRRRSAVPSAPLGSLTQARHRHGQLCPSCGSDRVTQLTMELTDGTPVQFLSCHVCETRVWRNDGVAMDVATVLSHTVRAT